MVAKLVCIYVENNEDPDVLVKSYLMSDGEIVYDTDVKSLVDVHISTDDFNSTSYVFVYHKDIENYFKLQNRNDILKDVNKALATRTSYSHEYFSIEGLVLKKAKLEVLITH